MANWWLVALVCACVGFALAFTALMLSLQSLARENNSGGTKAIVQYIWASTALLFLQVAAATRSTRKHRQLTLAMEEFGVREPR